MGSCDAHSVASITDSGVSFPLHPREPERLDLLYSLEILDSAEDERSFKNITDLAASIFHAPIALVSLVDHSRQWFKAATGIDSKETHRRDSFCNYTQMPDSPKVMVVLDPENDSRFRNNGLVKGPPYIRFYAGAPIIMDAARNLAIGSLCVIDTKKRDNFSDRDKQNLIHLSHMVRDLIKKFQAEKLIARKIKEKIFSTLCHEALNPMHIVRNLAEKLDDKSSVSCIAIKSKEGVEENGSSKETIKDSIIFQVEKVAKLITNMREMYSASDLNPNDNSLMKLQMNSRNKTELNLNEYTRDAANKYEIISENRFHICKDFSRVKDVTILVNEKLLTCLMNHCYTVAARFALFEMKKIKEKVLHISMSLNEEKNGLRVDFRFPSSYFLFQNIDLPLSEISGENGVVFGKEHEDGENVVLWFVLNIKVKASHLSDSTNMLEIPSTLPTKMTFSRKRPCVQYDGRIVLACEDERVTRMILHNILVKCGFERNNIFILCDGDEVLSFLESRKRNQMPLPDIGLFDIVMERMNGDECLQLLRKKGYNFPVVATTASKINAEVLGAGFQTIVNKPYALNDISFVVDAAFNRKKPRNRMISQQI